MTPYYQSGGITLYCADSRLLLPELAGGGVPKFNLCLTDPPYGVSYRGNAWDKDIPDWLPAARAAADIVAFTTAPTTLWDYPRPDWVAGYYRPASCSRTAQGGFNHWTPVAIYGKHKLQVDMLCVPNGKIVADDHPCPKPVSVFQWLLEELMESDGVVVDPFCGSGTTLVAAKLLGRRAVGIEISERYCEICVRRLSQDMLPLAAAPAPVKKELSL